LFHKFVVKAMMILVHKYFAEFSRKVVVSLIQKFVFRTRATAKRVTNLVCKFFLKEASTGLEFRCQTLCTYCY